MNTITIRLPDVEAAMLMEVQKVKKAYIDLRDMVLRQIRREHEKISRK